MKTQLLKSLPMNKQAGFTLVELIIVIVILGILAVTAAPRFLNLQGDANASTLEGLQGSIRSGMNIVNGKAIIASLHKKTAAENAEITGDNGENVPIVFGYPAASLIAFNAFLDVDFAEGTATGTTVDTGDFNLVQVAADKKVIIFPNSYVQTDLCRIEYTEASDANAGTPPVSVEKPTIDIYLTGC